MLYRRAFALVSLVAVVTLPAAAQSVISTRSGVIHFLEGAVYLDGQPLEARLGKFATIPPGSRLRTEQGRAEVLLTPGVFLRLGEQSSIRMAANDLADTRVELLSGSAIVDSAEPNAGTSVTLSYRDWSVHFLQKGAYRIDSDPPRLWVRQGEADVRAGLTGEPVSVRQGMNLAFGGLLLPEQDTAPSKDTLSDWADGRNQSISADNAITAQIDEDPASQALGTDSFTYFPMVGVPPYDPAFASIYPSFAPYQSGFSSIYLPGYAYRPYIIAMPMRGIRSYLPPTYPRTYIGSTPRLPASAPRPVVSPTGVRTAIPVAPRAPVTVAPVRPVAPARAPVGHAGGAHR